LIKVLKRLRSDTLGYCHLSLTSRKDSKVGDSEKEHSCHCFVNKNLKEMTTSLEGEKCNYSTSVESIRVAAQPLDATKQHQNIPDNTTCRPLPIVPPPFHYEPLYPARSNAENINSRRVWGFSFSLRYLGSLPAPRSLPQWFLIQSHRLK